MSRHPELNEYISQVILNFRPWLEKVFFLSQFSFSRFSFLESDVLFLLSRNYLIKSFL